MPTIFLTDVTLRDGSHAIQHQDGLSHIRDIAGALDAAGVNAIEIGRGTSTGLTQSLDWRAKWPN